MQSKEEYRIEKYNSLNLIQIEWDKESSDFFQSYSFLNHLEKYNSCSQRYYAFYKDDKLRAGAIVYTLPINVLTFSEKSFRIKMNVIGVPASVDSSGLIGDKNFFKLLVEHILKEENGFVLCLNYESEINSSMPIELKTLPTLIFNHNYISYQSYLSDMRHHYRRRALGAIKKFQGVKTVQCLCAEFTQEHYQLYLNIMKKTKTKLELLTIDFFKNLPENFTMISYYNEKKELLTWHITCEYKDTYSFLFGGINYQQRDNYDAYYNNLLGIVQEGINKGYKIINLGQTAEVPKMRVGGQLVNKMMFIYHKNKFTRFIFRVLKSQLEYKNRNEELKVFKNENSIF